ncbi:beta-ketoacyl synthase N-terminal-like domain-containing protein [Actinoallomurus sp. NPDC052274]|uniref:beta-ketoacyl synthase N-terminal-like domain-containing protein n=1 Tax=Actinoallomurus sp. NPDC052274 TaxID=3155420 RepID=UPI00341B14A6
MPRRVVISGLGPVASIGVGAAAFGAALGAGRSRITPNRDLHDEGFPVYHAGTLRAFDPASILERLLAGEWGDNDRLAAAAARLAVKDAGLDEESLRCAKAGAVVGTTHAETDTLERWSLQAILRGGLERADARLLDRMLGGNLALAVARELGLAGAAMVIPTVCAAGAYAIGYAADLVRHGDADVVIAGGADVMVRVGHAGFTRLGALADRCAPFEEPPHGCSSTTPSPSAARSSTTCSSRDTERPCRS